MELLTYILLFSLGSSLMYIYFINLMYKDLKNQKIEVSKKEYDKLSDDKNILIEELKECKDENKKLKLSLGLIDDHQYGVLSNTAINSNGNSLNLKCGFQVIRRGMNKVRIHINIKDIKGDSVMDYKTKEDIVELLSGWYDINDDNITWIVPDESRKREFRIDSILES